MIWKKSRRTKATASWIENTDPIRLTTYYILLHVKYLVIILVIYIFALTVSDIFFTLEGIKNSAVGKSGGYYWEKESPKLKI